MKKLKIRYNSPLIITFALLAAGIQLLHAILGESFIQYFTLPGVFQPESAVSYFRLFSWVLGHGSWEHLLGNTMTMLLVGPMLEEKYGSLRLLAMMVITALATAVLHIAFFDHGLLGASGIVFMLILLSSFTNMRQGEIPLTFVLVAVIFLGTEVARAVTGDDNVSQFAHILGGLVGGVFGFLFKPRAQPAGLHGSPKADRSSKKKDKGKGDAAPLLPEDAKPSDMSDIADLGKDTGGGVGDLSSLSDEELERMLNE